MKTELLKATGMTCGGCVNSLTRVLKSINGVDGVQVELSTGDTQVQYDGILLPRISSDRL